MTYFTLSSPFVHYLLPDSSVCFILKTGGAENSVHACRRRYAPSRTDQNARKNGIFVHCPYINKGVVHFPVWLFFCGVCRPGRQKHHGRNGQQCRMIFNFQANIWIIAVYIISIGYAVHGFADISRKIRHTIGFISHTNIPHIFASTHHRNRMIAT